MTEEPSRPDKTGSAGTQKAGPLEGDVLPAGETAAGFSESLKDIVVDNPRVFGGQGQTAMLVSIVQTLERAKDRLMVEKDAAQREARDAREETIRLRSDLRNERQFKTIKMLCAAAGVALITQCKSVYDLNAGLGALAGFLGVALLGAGLVTTSNKE